MSDPAGPAPGDAGGHPVAAGAPPAWLVPACLFLLALAIRLLAIPLVEIPPTEGSAYYVGVAANLVNGHGLVSDAAWSYATPPHIVPKPAFELWMPLATFVAALPMAVLGATPAVAQGAMAVLGACIAPLAWWVGRGAADACRLEARRARAVGMTSGLLAAVLAPFVVATAGPDSTTPFLVFGTLAAALLPGTLAAPAAGTRARQLGPGFGLGLALGLSWLSRQEAIWLGAAVLVMTVAAHRAPTEGRRLRAMARTLVPVAVGGLIVVLPWLARDAAVFGTPFPGQTIENLWLARNEDIFAWEDRPDAAGWLARGVSAIVGDRIEAVVHQLVSVLLLPPFPVGLAGLVAVVGLRRSPALRTPTALATLLLGGAFMFFATALLFPVATRWGTFLHASGPALAGLVVAAALGADALMARISRRRAWPRVNVIIAPIALLAIAVPLLGLQLFVVARGTAAVAARLAAVAEDVTRHLASAGAADDAVLITDHPMWLASATGRPAIALPDERPAAVVDLAAAFGAWWIVVMDPAGRAWAPDPADPGWAACLAGDPLPVGPADDPALLLAVAPSCEGDA